MPPPDPAATILERERSLLASETRAFATRRRRETTRLLAMQSSLFVVLLVAWWAASGTLVDPLFLSDPITVARALLQIAIDGTLWWHLQWTLIEMTLGYALGVAVGLGLAIAVTAIPWGAQILRPVMLGLFAIPKVALAPLVIVWFGIYLVPKVILAASLVLFVVYFNTVAGIAAVNLTMHEAVRVMGASRLALLTKLVLPSAAPYILTAMRIALPGALIGAIIGEFLSSDRGIGFLIAAASSRYDAARVFAGIFSLLVFVLLLNAMITRIERHLTRWQPLPEAKKALRQMPGADRFAKLTTDVLVVGGGLAALRAALSARHAGAEVLMVSKRQIGRSGSSVNTTGGYAAVVSDLNSQDEERLHYIDTIVGGCYVNDRTLVRALVSDAPARLRELLGYGAAFRRRDGHYHLSPSGDHSQSRVLVPQNVRGLDLTIPLREAVIAEGVKLLEDAVVIDLLRDDGRIAGATGVYRFRPHGFLVNASAVVLAAGGAGQLFATTSNPSDVCGSGYALALRAGARLRDMEFIQFYPWRLIHPFKSVRVPIQPSTFALGGRLYNSRGERFMEKYDPVRKESTTRDLSARGIADQISSGLSVEGGVVLDVSDVPDDQFRFENAKMIELLARKNVDYRAIQLIVAPEAHYFMGGIDINDNGHSSVEGLFAAGESAGGVHGGNRLNSNSIPDTQVFGHRAGVAAARLARRAKSASADVAPATALAAKLAQLSCRDDALAECEVLGDHLRQVMGMKVGLVRSREGLDQAIREITEVSEAAKRLPIGSQAELVTAVELGDLCESALACARSAACRAESRGAHYCADFPDADPVWIRTVLYDGDGIHTRAIPTDPDEERFLEYRAGHAATANRQEVEHVE